MSGGKRHVVIVPCSGIGKAFGSVSREAAYAVVQRNAQEAVPNKQARRLASLLRRDGLTLESIAGELNAHGYRTRRGKEFHKTTVSRLLKTEATATPAEERGPETAPVQEERVEEHHLTLP